MSRSMFNRITAYACYTLHLWSNIYGYVLINDAKRGYMSHFIFKLQLVEFACVESFDKTISHVSLSDRRRRERSMAEVKVIETCLCWQINTSQVTVNFLGHLCIRLVVALKCTGLSHWYENEWRHKTIETTLTNIWLYGEISLVTVLWNSPHVRCPAERRAGWCW